MGAGAVPLDSVDRRLDWDGCWNARDLGGIPAEGGRRTRAGALVRSDAVSRLTADGWAALHAHGVRTVIDLRNHHEVEPEGTTAPPDVERVHIALDVVEDREFWDHWERQAPPLYYGPFLERFPERAVEVVRAIAYARPGGVAFHCVAGRDRTGLVALLLLSLVGVDAEQIAADHALSEPCLSAYYQFAGEPDQNAEIAALLAADGTTAEAVILDLLGSVDVEGHLRAHGLSEQDLAALRRRVLA